jgi:hypothetical protein
MTAYGQAHYFERGRLCLVHRLLSNMVEIVLLNLGLIRAIETWYWVSNWILVVSHSISSLLVDWRETPTYLSYRSLCPGPGGGSDPSSPGGHDASCL